MPDRFDFIVTVSTSRGRVILTSPRFNTAFLNLATDFAYYLAQSQLEGSHRVVVRDTDTGEVMLNLLTAEHQ